MISALSTPAQQLAETFRLFQKAVEEIPENELNRDFGGNSRSVAAIVDHVVGSQTRYEKIVASGVDCGVLPPMEFETVSHAVLVDALEKSLSSGLHCLENVPESAVGKTLARSWGVWVFPHAPRSLDAIWFAGQMVRHAAYHCGQIYVYALMLERRK